MRTHILLFYSSNAPVLQAQITLDAPGVLALSPTIGVAHLGVACSFELKYKGPSDAPLVELQSGDVVMLKDSTKLYVVREYTFYPQKANMMLSTP